MNPGPNQTLESAGIAGGPVRVTPLTPHATDIFAPLAEVEAFLAANLSTQEFDRPVALAEAMAYSTLSAGKRLRPLLAWHACEACGGRGVDSLPAGASIELIHAFSLVHDDLPALDNDDLRRGKPTLHKHAGEAMAILAGDQLMVEAFVWLTQTGDLAPSQRLELCRELAAATSRMVSGQVYDTLGGLPTNLSAEDQLRLIHRNKTGALISAACRMGALSVRGGVQPSALAAITTYSQCVGLIFQIVDDLIDVEQTAEHTGKRTGKDIEAGKRTYPGILGIERSRLEVSRLRDEALNAIGALGSRASALRELCLMMCERTK